MDELFEMLTLIQTKKVSPIKVILVNKKFWSPMMKWVENTIYKDSQAVNKSDLKIFDVVQNADQAMALIHKMVRHKKIGHTSRESDTLEQWREGIIMPKKRKLKMIID
jgi:predicted Rossmann-fold nucleotide-binding protein